VALGSLGAVVPLSAVDGPALLEVRLDGAVVASATIDPEYVRSQPNGPLCPPVCWQADAEISVP
jgi:hypothetical protein